MRIHSLFHNSFEGNAVIDDWIEMHGYIKSSTKLYEGEKLPEIDSFDMLIILGGHMSVNDEKKYPWLKDEIAFIKSAIEADKCVVGICLGAQLISKTLGGDVMRNPHKEIGWFPVKKSIWLDNQLADFLPLYYTTFHWHSDIFTIPEGAVKIMESEACENQAFVYKNKVIAFQYHMEMRPQDLLKMIEYGRKALTGDGYVQTENEIINLIHLCSENNLYLQRVLDYLTISSKKQSQ